MGLGQISKLKVIGAAVVGLLIAGGVVFLITTVFSGGDEAGSDAFDEMLAVPTIDFSELPEPTEGPTPTPAPTPDIGATQLAYFSATQEARERVVRGDPLLDVPTQPVLGDVEKEYLSEVGAGMWHGVEAWMLLRRVAYRDHSEWVAIDADSDLDRADQALVFGSVLFPDEPPDGLHIAVLGYVNRVVQSIDELDEAHSRLASAYRLVEESTGEEGRRLGVEDRETLTRDIRLAQRSLDNFSAVMSEYGCSICGELIRAKPDN